MSYYHKTPYKLVKNNLYSLKKHFIATKNENIMKKTCFIAL